jgi:hypothetical protein
MSADVREEKKSSAAKNYKGFVAGVFSGIAKLSGKPELGSCLNPLPAGSNH